MKALITGIAGFAGSHLADLLVNKNNLEVFGLDIPGAKTDNLRHIDKPLKVFRCDICDFDAVSKVIRYVKPDLIFHLAAQAYVPDSWVHPAGSLTTNIIGTLNILESVRRHKLRSRIQIACSAEEYGRVFESEIPVRETNLFRPLSPYAVGKLTQDMLGYQYCQSYGMHIVRTRSFNHFGPRMHESFVASSFARQIALIEKGKQKPVMQVGNLQAVRDFTDVRDIVRGYWLSLTKCPKGEAYNLCSGKGYKIKDILDMLLSFTKKQICVKMDSSRFRPSDITVLVGDYSKFFRQTKWRPNIPVDKTLRDILAYWREKV
ncbi:MAG: GDP-mannose 4,6-dehydratase [Candidatus Omnitrophica bacterium]|nr:GDP-mannose 4,6-dehydratase [Candidatus Omnitrophota bacterium]